jgi:trehalose 6-phosphate phosphatase
MDHAYFLDFDGTLVEHDDRPSRVRVSEALRSVVDTLYQRTGRATAVISGRSLPEIDRIFHAPPRLPAAGQHGAERRTADGRLCSLDTAAAALDRVRPLLAAAVKANPRLTIEDKHQSLALHFRAAPALADTAQSLMKSMRDVAGDPYVLLSGKNVIELKPGGRDKGHAIQAFMQEPPFQGRRPIFLGVDVTDEVGFTVINRLDGLSIKVGAGQTSARYRLPNPSSVVEWLLSQDGLT